MPRIPEILSESVVYFFNSRESAEIGGTDGGTGFILGLATTDYSSDNHLYLVTAGHVIPHNHPVFARSTGAEGALDIVQIEPGQWIRPDSSDSLDLAVCPLGMKRSRNRFKDNWVPSHMLPRSRDNVRTPYNRGDSVFMVGRLIGYEGIGRNVTAVRYGALSVAPPVMVANTILGIHQESYIVELFSAGGFSGSPVFVYNTGTEDVGGGDYVYVPHANAVVPEARGPFLLGVNWGHLGSIVDAEVLDDNDEPIRTMRLRINSYMACVVPAWRLAEFLAQDNLETQRKEAEAAIERERQEIKFQEGSARMDAPDGGVITREQFVAALRLVSRPLDDDSDAMG